jgi:hypothetical protein
VKRGRRGCQSSTKESTVRSRVRCRYLHARWDADEAADSTMAVSPVSAHCFPGEGFASWGPSAGHWLGRSRLAGRESLGVRSVAHRMRRSMLCRIDWVVDLCAGVSSRPLLRSTTAAPRKLDVLANAHLRLSHFFRGSQKDWSS